MKITEFTYSKQPHHPIANVDTSEMVIPETIQVLNYEISGETLVAGQAVDFGDYSATASGLDNSNFCLKDGIIPCDFIILAKPINPLWGIDVFAYTAGVSQSPEAYFDPQDICELDENVVPKTYQLYIDKGSTLEKVSETINKGEYVAEVMEVTNPNYTVQKAIDKQHKYYIDPSVIPVPKAVTEILTYNGNTQVGVKQPSSSLYTLEDNFAVDAGK